MAESLIATFEIFAEACSVPPLPGAQNTCATCGEAASVTACAISRPPPPTTRTFAMGSLMGVAGALAGAVFGFLRAAPGRQNEEVCEGSGVGGSRRSTTLAEKKEWELCGSWGLVAAASTVQLGALTLGWTVLPCTERQRWLVP